MNRHCLIGNLGKDPEQIIFDNGNKRTTFPLATTHKWKDKNTGETKIDTQWHNIVANGRYADLTNDYLSKGTKVYIEGRSKTRAYGDDNNKKYITEVHVNYVEFLSQRKEQGTPLDSMPPKNQTKVEEEDDLPF